MRIFWIFEINIDYFLSWRDRTPCWLLINEDFVLRIFKKHIIIVYLLLKKRFFSWKNRSKIYQGKTHVSLYSQNVRACTHCNKLTWWVASQSVCRHPKMDGKRPVSYTEFIEPFVSSKNTNIVFVGKTKLKTLVVNHVHYKLGLNCKILEENPQKKFRFF